MKKIKYMPEKCFLFLDTSNNLLWQKLSDDKIGLVGVSDNGNVIFNDFISEEQSVGENFGRQTSVIEVIYRKSKSTAHKLPRYICFNYES